MRPALPSVGVALLILLACMATASRAEAPPRPAVAWKKVAAVDLPSPLGKRFDYLEVDEEEGLLLSAHLQAGTLYVIDLKTNRLVKAIPGLPGIEGVAHVASLHKAYVSDWHENKVAVIDLRSFEVTKKLPTESKPDGIAYAEPFGKVYVSNERGSQGLAQVPGWHSGSVSVFDVQSDSPVTVIAFDSETGVPQYDPVARRLYLNLEDKDELAVIDPGTDKVEARYLVEGCRGNHGMALDAEHRRAFLSCEGNDVLTVFDLEAHQAIGHLPMAKGADVVAFDPGLGQVYVACSSGFISVFKEDDPSHIKKIADVPVQRKVHSLAVDPRSHLIYVPEQEEDGHPVARLVVYQPFGK
jgi:DNA-binding beta-propeller fold protein YncE